MTGDTQRREEHTLVEWAVDGLKRSTRGENQTSHDAHTESTSALEFEKFTSLLNVCNKHSL